MVEQESVEAGITVPVDQDLSEFDEESYSSGIESYATSLTSSVTAYNWQHGRRYHGYKEGSYKFPNDEREQDRLDLFHCMFRLVLNGRLFLAPIEDGPLRVLDIGTGTGIWAIEFADEFPAVHEVLGNDLSPIQPHWVPPNVVFEVDDAEAEWPDRQPFDFIHSRYMCGSIQDWPRLLQQAYSQTKPGGWVEFQEFHLVNYSEDGTLREGNNVNRFYELLREACDKLQRPVTIGKELEGLADDAGFVNIHHQKFQLPLGIWPRERRMKEIGAVNMVQFLEGLEAFSAATFTSVLGWSIEEVQVFLTLVRKDAKDSRVHMMHDFHVVYAQKPL
ncbi:S-adenosyl-L-methionine-dependent methyltransferase [Aspergillus cavernicola]|uniref:S-adenosyl-L-methionine-dependent methyltransferase n=1 Tax=Aspergillus cavernicola TaxID=176166 RepID=A0ABR4I8Z7_9EURO